MAALVSVLMRSMGRSVLAEALDSVAAQTHAAVEVVVVNASGRPHPPLPSRCGPFELRLIEPGQALRRARACNAALDAARGDALLFLDDDDLIDPTHLARLDAALHAHPESPAAYAGVRQIAADGSAGDPWDEPFDADRLWLANFIPIHAMLFRRSVLQAGCRFDERFDLYEDWDFWLQLTRLGSPVHVPGVSATYRILGSSGAASGLDARDQAGGRQLVYAKWLGQLTAQRLERMAAHAEVARSARRLAERDLDASVGALDRAHTDQRQLRAEQAATQRQLRRAQADLAAARQAYATLEAGYHAVTASLSWRITEPLRRVRPWLSPRTWPRGLWRVLPLTPAARQRIRQTLARHALGQRLLRRLRAASPPAASGAGDTPTLPPLDKQAVRAEAEAALDLFLHGQGRIDLHCRDDIPLVSVIVVMFNQAGLTRLCLDALAASQGVGFETLLVDNGSTDRVPELLARVDGARVLRPGTNLGFLRAVNEAAAQARGRHLLLLNNDALVEPGTLAAAAARLAADAGAAAVGGPILLWDGCLQEAGSVIWRDGACQGYGRGDDPHRAEYRFVRDVDYCSGAFLLVRRDDWLQLGGFDDAFAPAYYEESDLCVRLWQRGRRVVYDPAVRVRHFEFASEAASGQALALQARNRALFVERHRAFLAGQPEAAPAALPRARQRLRPGLQRVLVIDDRVPLPWLGRGYPRAAELLRALAADGHAVTFYPLLFPDETDDHVRRVVPETVEVMCGRGIDGLLEFLRQRRGSFDTVLVSRPHNMQEFRQQVGDDDALLAGARVVYDAEAVFALRDAELARLRGRPWSERRLHLEVEREMALAAGVHAVCAVSADEATVFRQHGHRRVCVLGHPMQPVPDTPGFAEREGFVFLGAMPEDGTPNTDSVLWFVREVWPRIVAAVGPAAQLQLVGLCEAPSVLALRAPGLSVLGSVDEVAPYLDRARVFVVPTRYAAGIPHKAHEAAARGLPMVTTPLIARQLGWQELVRVGADAAAFAAACIELHGQAAPWQAMREGLLAAVARDCAPQAFRTALRAALQPDTAAARTAGAQTAGAAGVGP